MKQYKIIKIVFADSIKTAIKNEKEADIVDISLNEDIKEPNGSIGFKN
jgi:hypothetical protein